MNSYTSLRLPFWFRSAIVINHIPVHTKHLICAFLTSRFIYKSYTENEKQSSKKQRGLNKLSVKEIRSPSVVDERYILKTN